MIPEDQEDDSTLPLDEESEVESELVEALDQALLTDSDSDLDEDLVREMEEELVRPLSPLSSIEDSNEDSEGDEVRTFFRVPISTLSGSSSKDFDDETAFPSCSRIQSSSDSSSEEKSLLQRVRRYRRKGTEQKLQHWNHEREMASKPAPSTTSVNTK